MPPIVNEVLRSPGQPLDSATRDFMEPAFGHRFSQVRVHTDAAAAESAQAVNAQAYTAGSNIVFASSAYAPQTPLGRKLITHELVHVLQHQVGPAKGDLPLVSRVDAPAERQADSLAQRLALGRPLAGWIPVAPMSLLSLAPQTWYRGEAEGVTPAKDISTGARGVVHDLGEGTYLTDQLEVAEKYADMRAADNPAARRVLAGKIDPESLGRVLDLTKEPDFMKHFNVVKKSLGSVSGEPYRNMLDSFLKNKGLKLENFDAIIGPEGVRDGTQLCLRNPKLVEKVRASLTPVKSSGGGPSGGGEPPPTGERGTFTEGGELGGKLPAEGPKAPAGGSKPSTVTEPPAGGVRPRIGRTGAGRVAVNVAKLFGPMILDMLNRYFIAKAEAERAAAMISQKMASSDIQERIANLVETQRLEIARKQLRGSKVYVTISFRLNSTNDVLNTLSLSSLKITGADESMVSGPIPSHDPIFGTEKKTWWVDVSLPVDQVELSRTEEIKLKLEVLEEQVNAPISADPEAVAKRNEERNRLLAELQKAEKEEEKAKKEEIGRPAVIKDPKERAKQQSEIADELRRLNEKKKAAEPKKKEDMPKPPPGPSSLLPAPAPSPSSFLPGAPGEGPIEQAAKVVKSAEAWAQKLEKDGTALSNRLGTNNSPSKEERQTFLDEELKWRLSVKYSMNKFRENSREEAVNGLGELLDRFGPKLTQIRTYLGGD